MLKHLYFMFLVQSDSFVQNNQQNYCWTQFSTINVHSAHNIYLFFEHFIEFVELIVPAEYKPTMVVTCNHYFVNLQESQTNTNIIILEQVSSLHPAAVTWTSIKPVQCVHTWQVPDRSYSVTIISKDILNTYSQSAQDY